MCCQVSISEVDGLEFKEVVSFFQSLVSFLNFFAVFSISGSKMSGSLVLADLGIKG